MWPTQPHTKTHSSCHFRPGGQEEGAGGRWVCWVTGAGGLTHTAEGLKIAQAVCVKVSAPGRGAVYSMMTQEIQASLPGYPMTPTL